MIADINKDTSTLGSEPWGFTVFQSKLYFIADDGVNGSMIWCYDDTNSPQMITGSIPSYVNPQYLTVYKSKLYFGANDGMNGEELWALDTSFPWPLFIPAMGNNQ